MPAVVQDAHGLHRKNEDPVWLGQDGDVGHEREVSGGHMKLVLFCLQAFLSY